MPSEKDLHLAVANYLKYQYPGVIFRTDYAAGMKLPIWLAKRHKALQAGRAYPDLFIAHPRDVGKARIVHGLFLELKKEGTVLYKKDGSMRASANNHWQEQAEVLQRLTQLGYEAHFAVGYEQACTLIDWYMGRAKRPTIINYTSTKTRLPPETGGRYF